MDTDRGHPRVLHRVVTTLEGGPDRRASSTREQELETGVSSTFVNATDGGLSVAYSAASAWEVPPESGIPDVVAVEARPSDVKERQESKQPSSSCYVYPSRPPDPGTCGCMVKLRANYLPVQGIPDAVHEYHVKIVPDTPTRMIRHKVFQLAEQTDIWQQTEMLGHVAHDNASRLVSSAALPQPLEIQVHYNQEGAPGRQMNFTLWIKFVQVLDTKVLTGYTEGRPEFREHNVSPVVSALNLVQLAARESTGVVLMDRRRFFTAIHPAVDLDPAEMLKARRGFTMSLFPARGRLAVRVNVSMAPFYAPGNLATFMTTLQNMATHPHNNRFFTGARIAMVHLARSQRVIRGFTVQNADTYMAETPEFGQVSVRDYFVLKYGIQLRFSHLPLVQSDRAVIPPELCVILEQPCRKMPLGANPMAMINIARVSPNARAQMIQQFGQQPLGVVLSSFRMPIASDALEVLGRALPKPVVAYSANATYPDDHGRWNLKDARFLVGAKLERWVVLVIKDDQYRSEFAGVSDPVLRKAVTTFQGVCNDLGMNVMDPVYVVGQLPPRTNNHLQEAAFTAIKTSLMNMPKPQAILITLANSDSCVYQGLKHLCDVILDVTTICALSSKFRAFQPQYLASLALKLNMKLGGINHRLGMDSVAWLTKKPTMVVGIDVAHPSPGCVAGTPSIAAVVASVDQHFSQYPASLSLEWSEIVSDLKTMMIDRLKLYQIRNDGKLPERILVYRNGIGETLFRTSLEMEVPGIKDAFQSFSTSNRPYRPMLTIIVCYKSSQTWFWLSKGGGDGNLVAGTVVDRGVTSPYSFEFYLQAHGVVTGTARPTHYTVIYDETGATADAIQGATHALSYMYAPATHSVSLVAPVLYASLACQRRQCYLRKWSSDGGDADLNTQNVTEEFGWMGEVPGREMRSTMFYM